MPATANDWTVDMLDALPDDGRRHEIIDGELFVTPAPREVHQLIVGALYVRLVQYLKGHRIGQALVSPADVRRGDHRRNRVQPDILVVRLTGGMRPRYPYERRDLLLAVEVVSPSNPLLDYQVKRDLYLREGVTELLGHQFRRAQRLPLARARRSRRGAQQGGRLDSRRHAGAVRPGPRGVFH